MFSWINNCMAVCVRVSRSKAALHWLSSALTAFRCTDFKRCGFKQMSNAADSKLPVSPGDSPIALPSSGNFSVSLTVVESLPNKGRSQVAATDIGKDTPVFRAVPFAVCLFKNYRKRVCAECLRYHSGRLTVHCTDCRQVYFCDAICRARFLHKQHQLICPALRKMSVLKDKFDQTSRSILHLLVCVLQARWLERAQTRRAQAATRSGSGCCSSC